MIKQKNAKRFVYYINEIGVLITPGKLAFCEAIWKHCNEIEKKGKLRGIFLVERKEIMKSIRSIIWFKKRKVHLYLTLKITFWINDANGSNNKKKQ